MEWSEFARRLGRELAGLGPDTILIVRERDESRHYVQAMREPDRLYAEAVSNNFLDGPLLLTLADEEVMSEAGWQPPADPAPRNWWTELPAAAGPADFARLAEVMVTALRDVQGVRRPSDLVYESFHRHGTGLIELLDFGIEVADPARVDERRGSGAPAAPAWPAARPEPVYGAPVPPANGVPFPGPPGPGEPAPGPGAGLPGAGPPVPSSPIPASPLPPPPAPPGPAPAAGGELEARLAAARQRGDHATYFELLLTADLVLPAVSDADGSGLPIIQIGAGTYVTVFTSQEAMGDGPSYPTSFPLIAGGWPDPAWQLAINPGLPSEIHLDTAAVARLAAQQLAAEDAAAGPAAAPPAPGVTLRPPHGTRLWRAAADGGEDVPVAVYDAIGAAWTPVRTEALPTSRTD
ncbi:hypothetical protein ACRB68_64560 [Actinomadura sp. RB68]|uniref:SseB protein N-terminal domain-containing protein n=1 Tax=Actinomadura macrotermitis TaxID=2585200 RepID=A0A7K0C4H3_9ACTN|nr:hypothetical protein [Actinomadura macrotermitis]